jgi:hypothetical protein
MSVRGSNSFANDDQWIIREPCVWSRPSSDTFANRSLKAIRTVYRNDSKHGSKTALPSAPVERIRRQTHSRPQGCITYWRLLLCYPHVRLPVFSDDMETYISLFLDTMRAYTGCEADHFQVIILATRGLPRRCGSVEIGETARRCGSRLLCSDALRRVGGCIAAPSHFPCTTTE